MKPWGFAFGVAAGAAAALLLGREGNRARPVAKAALKAAVLALHEARVQGAQLMEAAEDLFAEVKAEAASEIFTAATGEAKKAAGPMPEKAAEAAPQPASKGA
ncbi:DUF5132 domain-containing protein [Methylocystis sp. MJC1]|jgi:gas vesicle protein|uniref:DUF5132 domain-containing protein n=1 Tax=Methylocystis sp. MJC1 TaxID=2654282 RepID=UPI0013EDBA23|nr:DUF5132 domain-containing protein [Methylocystis sp. MJC1]KAF2992190.1 hypothetical protein MJC1_00566 [Methylocystis sp. MJC1]MBU6527331.1 DUF5132 domain-containing protein [Methylocystis sp. MJC1]UZX10282.1 DUF5132 domain-containing protein [Methylocystis sp. MJC1]